MFSQLQDLCQFCYRAVPGGCDPGNYVFRIHDTAPVPVCHADRDTDRVYSFGPIFGAFIGCVVGTFLMYSGPHEGLAFIVLFLVLQQVEGNLMHPHVVGNSVGLPSIWVLVAVTVGGSLMGVVGMPIFIPLTSVVYALFRQTVYKKLKERNIHDI